MQTINVVTGFGYYTDNDTGKIIDKAVLPKGEHPLADGITYTEVADQEALDKIQVYVDPVKAFLFKPFWGYVFSELSAEATYALSAYQTVVESFWYYPNISAIRPFLQGLVGQVLQPGNYTVLQSDMDIIIQGFAEQGVIL